MNKKLDTLIPILQSSLPPFDHALPYLHQIEKNRCHTNFGKLFREFEERLAQYFSVQSNQVTLMCNGTQALTLALLAYKIPAEKYCLMPSWTFSATPASAVLAGLKPLFLDVDLKTQILTPDHILHFLAHHHTIRQEDIGAVMVVSPFGMPLNRSEWDRFTHQTGIPVIIDAAASFDSVHQIPQMAPGETPMMISLHATKVFGIGEGGMLISTDADFIQRARGLSNFGFDVSRLSSYVGTNAKMSEYQAAIGLAAFDSWPETRARRLAVTKHYLTLFDQLGLDHWLSTDWLTSTCNVLVPGCANELRDYLVKHNIEARVWWGKGCHSHPAYQYYPRELDLLATEKLSNTMLALPFSIDTTAETIELIGDYIEYYLAEFFMLDSQYKHPAS